MAGNLGHAIARRTVRKIGKQYGVYRGLTLPNVRMNRAPARLIARDGLARRLRSVVSQPFTGGAVTPRAEPLPQYCLANYALDRVQDLTETSFESLFRLCEDLEFQHRRSFGTS